MIAWRPAAAAMDQERFEVRPLIVGHQSANQGCPPQRAALNQFAILASIGLLLPRREIKMVPIGTFAGPPGCRRTCIALLKVQPRANSSFRPPGFSPSQYHLTRCF